MKIGQWYIFGSTKNSLRSHGRCDAYGADHVFFSSPFMTGTHGLFDAREIIPLFELPSPTGSESEVQWLCRALNNATAVKVQE